MAPDDEFASWLQAQAEQHLFSGVTLAWRHGAPVLSAAAGIADRRNGLPVTAETRFSVASVTKMVTAASCLRLVDRGLLDLHQPVRDILPAEHRIAALSDDVTTHHLLSHTSGLEDYFDDDDDTWATWYAAWDRVPTYRVRTPADLLPLFANLPPRSAPGAVYRYTNANYVLAGLVIEAVTGAPWTQVATDEVLRPAGLSDSGFPHLDSDPPGLATGYLYDADLPWESWRSNIFGLTAAPMPDGGMITTAEDLARLLDAVTGGELLSARSTAAMTTSHLDRPESTRYGYGCELELGRDGRVAILGHSGMDPGAQAQLWRYTESETTLVVVCNQDRGGWPALQQLARVLGIADTRA